MTRKISSNDTSIGAKYGELTVISDVFKHTKAQCRAVKCKCSCGNIIIKLCSELHKYKKCKDCLGKDIHKYNIGYIKGDLTVIGYRSTPFGKKIKVQCKCGYTYLINRGTLNEINKCRTCYLQTSKVGSEHGSYKGTEFVSQTYYSSIKNSSNKRKIECSITIDYINNLLIEQNHKCKLSGLPIKIGNARSETTASLDRINSDLGYIENNVQWVHKDINKMKLDLDQKEFLDLCELITNKRKENE